MVKTLENATLQKNAKVNVLFQLKEGYLFVKNGEKIFIEVENGQIRNIYFANAASEENIGEALYLVEEDLNSLGMDIKNNPMEREVIEDRLKEAFDLQAFQMSFDVLEEGEIVSTKVEEEKEVEAEEGFFSVSSLIEENTTDEKIVEERKEENKVETSPKGENLTLFDEEAFEEPKQEDTESAKVNLDKKLTREEKQIYTKKLIIETLQQGTTRLQHISNYVQERIDVSGTHVRNMAEELVAEGKILKLGRGKYGIEGVTPKENVQVSAPKVEPRQDTVVIPTVPKVEEVTRFPEYFDKDEEVLEQLNKLDLPEELKTWVMDTRKKNRERVKGYPQSVVDTIPEFIEVVGRESVLKKAFVSIRVDQPLGLKGPAGVGKTKTIELIASILNYPLFTLNGHLDSNRGAIVGEITTKERGVLTVQDGQMTKAAKYGGILYIDEINMLRPDNLSLINPFTDDRKYFYSDVHGETIVAHPMSRFACSMNEGYVGVKKLNEATKDRMVFISLSFLTKPEVKSIIRNIYEEMGLADTLTVVEMETYIEKVARIYGYLTSEVENGLIPDYAGSVRNVIQIAKIAPIIGFKEAIEMFLDKYSEEEAGAIHGVLSKDGLLSELT